MRPLRSGLNSIPFSHVSAAHLVVTRAKTEHSGTDETVRDGPRNGSEVGPDRFLIGNRPQLFMFKTRFI